MLVDTSVWVDQTLACIAAVSHGEAVALVAERRLWTRGLGWIDVNLLAAALVGGADLWTPRAWISALVETKVR